MCTLQDNLVDGRREWFPWGEGKSAVWTSSCFKGGKWILFAFCDPIDYKKKSEGKL